MRNGWAMALLAAVACATSPDVTAWRMAKEVDTPAAYRDFTTRYPRSSFVDEAQERLAQSEQTRVARASTVADCVAIARSAPANLDRAALGDQALKAALADPQPDAQHLFLEHFGAHPGAPKVRARLEALELEQALRDGSPAALEGYLLRHPGAAAEGRVRAQLAEKAWAEARARGGQLAAKAFLARFGESAHAAEARALVRPSEPRPGGGSVQAALDEALKGSPALQRRACALTLSASIRRDPARADAARRQLLELERSDQAPPEACATARLQARPRQEGNLAEALEGWRPLEALRREAAERWEAYRQREELARAAAAASASLGDELETAELAEQVLGAGPLGGIDVGPDKGSGSARRANERLQAIIPVIERKRAEVTRLLAESEVLHRTLTDYVMGCVDAR